MEISILRTVCIAHQHNCHEIYGLGQASFTLYIDNTLCSLILTFLVDIVRMNQAEGWCLSKDVSVRTCLLTIVLYLTAATVDVNHHYLCIYHISPKR